MEQNRTVLRELTRIVVFSACLWGAFGAAWWWHHRQHQARQSDERFLIKRLAVRPVTADRLPLSVLSELLEVDGQKPLSLFAISTDQARCRLMRCPALADARVWKLLPGTLGVEYMLRTPVATLAGLKNVGIDEDGKLFFLFPLYAPKRLPTLVLPLKPVKTLSEGQKAVRNLHETAIALKLLERLNEIGGPRHMVVDSIDVTNMPHPNVFRREVVVVVSSLFSKDQRLYIRMNLKHLLHSLDILPKLFDQLMKGAFRSGTIDLRFEQTAILKGEVAQK